jgi:hypothetical protein
MPIRVLIMDAPLRGSIVTPANGVPRARAARRAADAGLLAEIARAAAALAGFVAWGALLVLLAG